MKLQIQKDFDASEFRLSQASSYMTESRAEGRKKNSHKSSQECKKKSSLKLKQILEKLKIKEISKQFTNKLTLLVPLRNIPNELLSFRQEPTNLYELFLLKLKETLGFKIGTLFNLVWRIIIFLKIICMVVFTSLLLGFQGVQFFEMVVGALEICITISIVDIFINFFCQKFENNRNLKTILSIANSYIKNDFLVDFMTVVFGASLRISLNYVSISILMALAIIKLWRSIYKIEFLEHVYITNVWFEKYFAIGRVFFFNFLIAHFIAITLLLMAKIDMQTSWITAKELANSQWSEQYIWACYWGINIMLTVGFGDFSANNKHEALVLVFIQLISCMIFAYNINIIGSILTDMKQRERQRKNQMRVLLKMAKQNEIDNNLLQQAVNYVDESFKIKEKFQYENHDQIIENLPISIQSEYKKQTNRKMMLGLSLVNYFSQKSLLKVAEKVVRKLAHPEQIIWKKNQLSRLVILYDAKLGLTYRRDNSTLNGSVIQVLKAASKKSKILSLNFFKNQRYAYDIKSLNYGIIYHLSNEEFADALRQRSTDYQVFCSYRDRPDCRLEAGQLYKCSFCPLSKHDYFNCPKMHLVMLKDHIISKSNLGRKNYITCPRDFIPRTYKSKSYIKQVKLLKTDHESFINLVSWKSNKENDPNQNTMRDVLALAMSEKIATSIRSNQPISHIFREFDIQKLNTILVGKLNDQEMCKGYWELECDMGHNFSSYFRTSNPDNLKDFHLKVNKSKIYRYNSLHMNTMFSQTN